MRRDGSEAVVMSKLRRGETEEFIIVIRPSEALVAVSEQTVCPAGQCGLSALFITLSMFEFYF